MKGNIFHAIDDPTRQAIISLIAMQAMTPNAIAKNFKITRHSACRHLRILAECQLVKPEQQGWGISYSLEIEKMKEIHEWLKQFRKIWEPRFRQFDKIVSTIKKQEK